MYRGSAMHTIDTIQVETQPASGWFVIATTVNADKRLPRNGRASQAVKVPALVKSETGRPTRLPSSHRHVPSPRYDEEEGVAVV